MYLNLFIVKGSAKKGKVVYRAFALAARSVWAHKYEIYILVGLILQIATPAVTRRNENLLLRLLVAKNT